MGHDLLTFLAPFTKLYSDLSNQKCFFFRSVKSKLTRRGLFRRVFPIPVALSLFCFVYNIFLKEKPVFSSNYFYLTTPRWSIQTIFATTRRFYFLAGRCRCYFPSQFWGNRLSTPKSTFTTIVYATVGGQTESRDQGQLKNRKLAKTDYTWVAIQLLEELINRAFTFQSDIGLVLIQCEDAPRKPQARSILSWTLDTTCCHYATAAVWNDRSGYSHLWSRRYGPRCLPVHFHHASSA